MVVVVEECRAVQTRRVRVRSEVQGKAMPRAEGKKNLHSERFVPESPYCSLSSTNLANASLYSGCHLDSAGRF